LRGRWSITDLDESDVHLLLDEDEEGSEHRPGCLSGYKLASWIGNQEKILNLIYPFKYLGHVKGKSIHSKTVRQEGGCPFAGVCWDEFLLDPIRAFLKKPDPRMGYKQLLGECLSSLSSAINSECERHWSDEYLSEYFDGNDIVFMEDGTQMSRNSID
jgi:hypothetical protein